MKSPTHPRGVTLIELTVVISVVLTLLSTLFLGASYYRDSASQAACVSQITQIQKGIRSYQNLEGLEYGEIVPNLESLVVGPDKALGELPQCPLNDQSSYILLTDRIPNQGEAYARCELYGTGTGSNEQHFPTSISGF